MRERPGQLIEGERSAWPRAVELRRGQQSHAAAGREGHQEVHHNALPRIKAFRQDHAATPKAGEERELIGWRRPAAQEDVQSRPPFNWRFAPGAVTKDPHTLAALIGQCCPHMNQLAKEVWPGGDAQGHL